MPLFVCDACGSVENTALASYWTQRWEKEKGLRVAIECSACLRGDWHGRFERHQWDGTQKVLNREADS